MALAFILAILLVAGALSLALALIDWTPEGSDVYAGGTVFRDAAGSIIRVALGDDDEDCRPTYRADANDWIVKALVASEDTRFWSHCGVRPESMLRALFQNIVFHRRVSGASTITMQAVRLIRPHRKSYAAKFVEAIQALKMERQRDKLWILSQYLNRAAFGSNFIGIESAAQGWFGKPAKSLSLAEAALLAGMVQAPSRYRPDRWMDRALKRREYVLGQMREEGIITAEQLADARRVVPTLCRAPRPFRHPYFCDFAAAQLRARGLRGGDCRTTLVPDVQALCDQVVAAAARRIGCSSAAVVMRADTGAVLALACSGDYFDPADGQVNTALAFRPAGSTLKPFLAALAFDRGQATPSTRLEDVPMAFRGYRPANFDGKYRGTVTVADALVLSLNLPFVRLLNQMGLAAFGEKLCEVGVSHAADVSGLGLGMAIGNVEVSLLELVGAYGALANGGVSCFPTALQDWTAGSPRAAFSPGAAFLVSDILASGKRSTAALGHVADVAVASFAWKTGTSAGYRDAWTVAWNPEYVIGVWCGHKRGGFGDTRLTGLNAAAPSAWEIARSLYPNGRGPFFRKPDSVVRRQVCALSGEPAGPDCPTTEEGVALEAISSSSLCRLHFRDAEGQVRERNFGLRRKLTILSPTEGTVIGWVAEMPQQRVVFRATGHGTNGRLWWFAEGVLLGESVGENPFACALPRGKHAVSCVAEDGACATVSFQIQ